MSTGKLPDLLLAICLGGMVYVYAGYPILLAILSVCFKRRRCEPDYTPAISVLIAAYNEEEGIRRKLEQTLALNYPAEKLEILVLSDCSTDATDEIVGSIGDGRVRLLRMNERRGKTHAQNEGVPAASGEVIVFSDATTVYHPMALRYLVSQFRDPQVGAATGRNQYFDAEHSSPTGSGTIAFWNYENIIKALQSKIHTLTGCVGCIYAVRKSAYVPLADDVISDLVEPLRLIEKGWRIVFEERALAFEETTRSSEEEFRMRVRVVTRGMRGLLNSANVLKPWRFPWISFQVWSHKIARWLVPWMMLGVLAGCLLAREKEWVQWLLLAQGLFYTTAIAALAAPLQRISRVLAVPLYFCTLNAAALVALVSLCLGRKYVVWKTVRVPDATADGKRRKGICLT